MVLLEICPEFCCLTLGVHSKIREGAERAERSETLPAPIRYARIPGRRRSRTRNVIACWRALIGVSLAEIAEIAGPEVPVPWVPLTL